MFKIRHSIPKIFQFQNFNISSKISYKNPKLNELVDLIQAKKFKDAEKKYYEINKLPTGIRLYNDVMKLFINLNNDDKVKSLFEEILNIGFLKPNLYTFNLLLSYFTMKYKAEKEYIDYLLTEMERLEIDYDVRTINILINYYYKIDLKRVESLIKVMKTLRITPNILIFNSLLKIYCQLGNHEMVQDTIEKCKQLQIPLGAVSYTIIVTYYLKFDQKDKIKELYMSIKDDDKILDSILLNLFKDVFTKTNDNLLVTEIEEKLIKIETPEEIIFKSLIKECENNNFENIEKIWTEIKSKNLKLDLNCFHALINYYIRTKNTEMIEDILGQMNDKQVNPTTYTLNILITYFITIEDCDRMEGTLYLYKDIKYNHYTYNTLIEHYGQQKNEKRVLDLLNQMSEQKVQPNIQIYTTLLKIYSFDSISRNNFKSFDFEEIIKTIQIQKLKFTTKTFYLILSHYQKIGDKKKLNFYMDLLNQSKLQIDTALKKLLISIKQ